MSSYGDVTSARHVFTVWFRMVIITSRKAIPHQRRVTDKLESLKHEFYCSPSIRTISVVESGSDSIFIYTNIFRHYRRSAFRLSHPDSRVTQYCVSELWRNVFCSMSHYAKLLKLVENILVDYLNIWLTSWNFLLNFRIFNKFTLKLFCRKVRQIISLQNNFD